MEQNQDFISGIEWYLISPTILNSIFLACANKTDDEIEEYINSLDPYEPNILET